MRYLVEIEPKDIEAVHKILDDLKLHPFVQARRARNIDPTLPELTPAAFWATHLMCLLTTQNKSGAGSAVDKFLLLRPFPLAWEVCRSAQDVDRMIMETLSSLGIRRWKISGGFAQQNFRLLENGGMQRLHAWSQRLLVQRAQAPESSHYLLEREAARDLQKMLKGIGPKQSRNFWQDMGLTRYEIPLDSRVIRWLNKQLSFDVPVTGLADEQFYCQVLDALRELAARTDVLPCMLDAVIFASFER